MQETQQYDQMVTRQRKWMLYYLAVLVLGAGFSPYPDVFLGLILGSALSFYNLWLLQRKINKFGQAILDGKTMLGLGTITRLASAVLAVVIALRFEEHFNIIATIIGLMTAYIVIMIDFLLFSSKD